MLKVTIELVPGGDYALRRKIAECLIANDETSVVDATGNYFAVFKSLEPDTPAVQVEIRDFSRAMDAWSLLGACLDAKRA